MDKQSAMIYLVLDGKSERPRIRIEDGKTMPDGTWSSWCELEYLTADSFFEACADYWKNRGE